MHYHTHTGADVKHQEAERASPLAFDTIVESGTTAARHRHAPDDGFAYFSCRDRSPYPMLEVALRGVSPERKYKVEYRYGYATDKTLTMSGRELQKLRVEIPKRGGSLLLKYRAIDGH